MTFIPPTTEPSLPTWRRLPVTRRRRLAVLIAQSDLNHSRSLIDREVVIERGANVVAAAQAASQAS